MNPTLGIHWIVTTHGTWLHGDPRGSWKDGRLLGPDPFLEKTSRDRMPHDAVVLNDVEIMYVSVVWGQAIVEWDLRVYAATIRPTHAHVVFAPMKRGSKDVVAGLKRRSAAAVLRVRRNMCRDDISSHLWTGHPWLVFMDAEDHLFRAIEYVRDHNRRVGLPADPYSWIDSLQR